jgi:hypothetical protein
VVLNKKVKERVKNVTITLFGSLNKDMHLHIFITNQMVGGYTTCWIFTDLFRQFFLKCFPVHDVIITGERDNTIKLYSMLFSIFVTLTKTSFLSKLWLN